MWEGIEGNRKKARKGVVMLRVGGGSKVEFVWVSRALARAMFVDNPKA